MRRVALLTCLSLLVTGSAAMSQDKRKPGEVVEVKIAKDMQMKFCWIPAGKAQLGSPKSEQDYLIQHNYLWRDAKGIFGKANRDKFLRDSFKDETESKRGEFTTKGFWLGKYPVTQEQWEAVMGNNPSWFSKQGERQG